MAEQSIKAPESQDRIQRVFQRIKNL